MVNLALSNGQVVSTTLANLQSIAQPQNMLNTPTSNGEFTGKWYSSGRCPTIDRDFRSRRNLKPRGMVENSSIPPYTFHRVSLRTRRSRADHVSLFHGAVPTSPGLPSGLALNPAALPHLLSNSSASQQLLNAMQPQQLLQAAQAAQAQAAQAAQAVQASLQPLLTTSPQRIGQRHSSHMNHYTVREPLITERNNLRLFRLNRTSRGHSLKSARVLIMKYNSVLAIIGLSLRIDGKSC